MKTESRRLGFSLTGVTTPDPPPHLSTFENWLALGRHADMDYLATERSLQRRADARCILPGCRSILALGIRYPNPALVTPAAEHNSTGRIAAYAWGLDYHVVLPEKMEALVHSIQTHIGYAFPYLCYTDSGPILERDLAQQAGLGWIGKNTCLIHPRLGSYILLAEILLGIELEVDTPFEADRCGTCTRCIQACPTGCILPGRTLDASRCISYVSIEMKTSIPLEFRPVMGNWVFGCDICQMVCPWNRFTSPDEDAFFSPNRVAAAPVLMEELALDAQAFNQKYKNTALMRARRNRYLRNVIVALANSGYSEEKFRSLKLMMNDPNPLIKEHASWAMAQWT
ncbi:MAG: tRNA epoxyqueuosine(34) reductase QueG [Chloroflexi bacterium GWB2_49_20]|nr:MAG: tRNA epoxyqueuosine(34) reductase QueG [Chloroflexi bacterium GWB2_49_20]OGN77219.1 MAG: tRNA epoxyqueuosine(34) reductase QueG [Chloroflexi bacterium GWC2_49_37]OGN83945.1 MAG: tRNA epoxyqueuosine(34) reductase QueG [Chloroflexi bacterium GWD2_49_16]